ncbi:MAG: exonuclease subunit SbcD [Cyanothece sp. SIO1E1]|nr:exonuclease subunit SbcD [Cyanothece sp. SIO1E1]
MPTVLLVGNHDQHSQGAGGASLCIYRTLGVPGFVVGDRLETHCIQTRQGPIQIITLPWLTRSTLMTRPETEGLSMSEVNHLLLDRLRVALEGEIRRLNPQIPTVLLAHLMTDTARYGAERFLAVSKGFTVPMALLARPCFDYVALGHVHRHQILCEQPLIVYPGSIERVDFSEEKEDKGFVIVEIEPGHTRAEFHPLSTRPFKTIIVNLVAAESPQHEILKAIEAETIESAVVRLIYQLRADQLEHIDSMTLHTALSIAHTYTIHPELISQLARPRLPELGTDSSIDPLGALTAYLGSREDLTDIAHEMLTTAQKLIAKEVSWVDLDKLTTDQAGTPPIEPLSSPRVPLVPPEDDNQQLRLL